MIFRSLLVFFVSFFSFTFCFSQAIGINSTNSSPDASAILDITSTSKGFLLPRMTSSQMSNISSPATGLMVYQTNGTPGFYFYSGNAWVKIDADGVPVEDDPEVGTNTANYIPKWNGTELVTGTINDYQGKLGIGVSSPTTYSIQGPSSFSLGVDLSSGGTTRTAEMELYNASDGAINFKTYNSSTGGINFYTQGTKQVTISQSGYLGIGDGTPEQRFEVADHLSQIISNSDVFISNIHGYHNNGLLVHTGYDDGVDIARFSSIGNSYVEVPRLVIKDNGRVGVGTDSPSANFELESSESATLLIDGNTGGGAPSWASRILLNSNIDYRGRGMWLTCGDNDDWYAGVPYGGGGFTIGRNATEPEYKANSHFFVAESGNVGIGTTNPNRGKLQITGNQQCCGSVVGSFNYFIPGSGYTQWNWYSGSSDFPISVYADGRFMGAGIHIFSDERIKDVVGKSNNSNDLKTLMNIEITDYYLKDKSNGNRPYKKVIAQQVKEVYPQAVSLTTDIVPDIYKIAKIDNGRITLKTNLKVGEKVKLIFKDKKQVFEVLNIDKDGFNVSSDKTGNVFVYGREVDDFHSVDYESISMLNVSATQQLFHLLMKQQEKIMELSKRKKTLIEDNNSMKAQLDKNTRLLEEIQKTLNVSGSNQK
ncbi:MAG: tail fiber domain-containing protein [Crocinitomicaceae bacterium]|nr:tail fiber domain-containing protein [Crocinitomicaceae bacterium]